MRRYSTVQFSFQKTDSVSTPRGLLVVTRKQIHSAGQQRIESSSTTTTMSRLAFFLPVGCSLLCWLSARQQPAVTSKHTVPNATTNTAAAVLLLAISHRSRRLSQRRKEDLGEPATTNQPTNDDDDVDRSQFRGGQSFRPAARRLQERRRSGSSSTASSSTREEEGRSSPSAIVLRQVDDVRRARFSSFSSRPRDVFRTDHAADGGQQDGIRLLVGRNDVGAVRFCCCCRRIGTTAARC